VTVFLRRKRALEKGTTEEESNRANKEELKKLYPDYRKEDTFVVKRTLFDAEGNQILTWEAARSEVEDKYGRIYEDVVGRDKAELLGTAYFRVAKPGWTR
jgi:hypothetical protein